MLQRFFFPLSRPGHSLPLLALPLLVLACCSPSWAQMASQGTVTVTVVDPTGGAVQGAKLQLQELATNGIRESETQQVGSYNFVALPAGTYRLTVSKSGFQTEVLDSVIVQSNRVTDVKVTLKVGAAVEKVVVAESSAPLVETTSSAIAQTIDMKQIEDLPLQGRDISSLAFLTPGFAGTPGNGTWNGLPVIAQGNNIDGISASTSRMKFSGNTQPGLEARLEDLQEMTVQTEQTDLSQGLGQASMQVNFVTRRGSNDLHGRVFEDFRNTALNANSWFNNAVSTPGNPVRRNPIILNDFGGSVGGPILKDKLFFFGSFAMAKQPGGFIASNVVLSPAAQQGIYTYYQSVTGGPQAGQTVNLFTQVAQPNGLPATVNSQIAAEQALINQSIAGATGSAGPNGSADTNLLTVNWLNPSPTTRYYPAIRVDYNLTQKLRLDFSLQETKINQPNASPPIFPGSVFANQVASNKSNNYITSIGLNWTVTPNLINQFRGGYYYNWYVYGTGAKPIWLTRPAISWPICTGYPHYGNCSGNAFNLPVSTFYPIVDVIDNAALIRGRHTVTLGFDFHREQDHYWNAPDGMQNMSLGPLAAGDPALNDFNSYFANASAADRGEAENIYSLLVGRISGIGPTGSGFPYDPKTGKYATTPGSSYNLDELQKMWGLYAQDSFRFTPHLTFNYGLRWDFTGDDHDLTSAYHGASISAMYGPSGVGNLFRPGTLTGDMNPAYVASSHQYAPWNVSPQPTLGLAWNPSHSEGILGKLLGGSSTVIRTGFDIKRFTEPYQYFWNNASNHGLAFFQNFSYNAANGGAPGTFSPGTLSLGDTIDPTKFTYSPPAYAASLPETDYTWSYYWGASGFDPHIHQPYVQEWNLGIQRQLGQNNVLEVRYLGHRSLHQWIQTDPNEVNVFENGFLKEFKNAQSNLAICMANASCASNLSFANQGLPGQVPLPIFTAAFACPPGGCPSNITAGQDFTNSGFIIDLNQGAAGALASQLAYPFGTVPYICNLVGSSLSPCEGYGYTSPGTYPLNFFQVNPLGASFPGVMQSYTSAAGYGTYHALQVDFRQKQWHGMQFDVNYTYSHTLGLQPDNQWLGTVTEFTLRDLRQSYGPTSFDLRHVVHASGTFDLPFGKGKALANRPGAVDKLVGGWSLGTIVTWQTGLPFQLFGGYGTFNDYGDGGFVLNGITKAQLQNAVGVYHTSGPYIDVINPKLLQGNSSPNCNSVLTGVCQNTTPGVFGINPWLYGVHVWNDDTSLTKAVPINEKVRFTLQAEFLNLFNHPNFTTPGQPPYYYGSTNLTSGGFGQASSLNFTNVATNNNTSARVIELRANITF
ncbi:MAG: carboxypeptidase regulatory-like domain-containing protein [Acidobacteria bacterium]|nr:MAG: carboxypeptidase regulatory-like domain-containing protein [Acidobacteriota bacterium]